MTTTFDSGSYSFQDVHASIVGPNINCDITGAAEEGYSIEFDGDKSTLTMGADGSGMLSLHALQNGTLTLRILKTAPINQQLSNAYKFQTLSAANNGKMTITVADPVRGDTFVCKGCSFRKFPNISYGMDGGTNEWAFLVTRIFPDLGSGADYTFTG